MRVIIAGSRGIRDYDIVKGAIANAAEVHGIEVTTVISGGAKGVDRLGEVYAYNNKIPYEVHPAEWSKFGKSAGYRRNAHMATIADALIAIWDGESPGTRSMIELARRRGLRIHIQVIRVPVETYAPKRIGL